MLLIVRMFVCSFVRMFGFLSFPEGHSVNFFFDIAQHFIDHSYIIEWEIDESKGFAPWGGNIVDGIIALNREADIGSVVEAGVAFYKTFGGYEGGDILWVVG